MIVKYDSLNRFEKPKLTLCNPGAKYENGYLTRVLGTLSDYDSEEIVFNFNSTSDLNFRIYKVEHDDAERNAHAAFLYNAIQNRRLIFVEDIGFFVISDTNEGFDGHQDYIDVTARSVDDEIEQKKVPYIEDGTYQFYTSLPVPEGDPGLLNKLVEILPIWTIGTVDQSVAERYRTFEDVAVDANILSFMVQNMQDAYECIFVFDIVNRIINVYDQNNYVRLTNIHLTKEDLIDSLNVESSSGDVYTAIDVLGADNITISSVNPLGTNVIYDFSYYIDWMTPELGTKVAAWQQTVEQMREQYYNTNLEYYSQLTTASTVSQELQKLNTQLTIYHRLRDNIVAGASNSALNEYNSVLTENSGTPITITENITSMLNQIDALIGRCQQNIAAINSELDDANQELDELEDEIVEMVNSVAITNYFTQEEYEELYYYIFEGSYTDDYVVITDVMTPSERFDQMKTLHDRALSQLKRVSKPTQQFTLDVENFVFAKEFEPWSEQLETGCLINVELKDDDVAPLFLTNITINYDDHSLSMTFGNRFNKYDPKTLFENVLGGINRSSNSINYLKEAIYPIKSGEFNSMREQLQASRNLTMEAALATTNEEVTIDGAGYTSKELLGDGTYDPRQVKLTGKSLVFTDDAWETCKVAIGQIILGDGSTTYGINAETIIGDLIIGNQLVIKDNEGNDLFTVIDGRIASSVSSIETKVNNAITDTTYYYVVRDAGVIPGENNTDWSTTYPTSKEPGQHIWRKTVVTYGGTTTSTKAIEDITGDKGEDGTIGEDGKSVVSIIFEYCISGSDTEITPIVLVGSDEAITGEFYPSISEWQPEWTETPPEYVPGYFFWRRAVTTYSDGTVEIGEPYLDRMLNGVWVETVKNSTAIDQTNEHITMVAKSVATTTNAIGDLQKEITDISELIVDDKHIATVVSEELKEYDLNGLIATVNNHTTSIEQMPGKIEASVTETIKKDMETEYHWAKQWLNKEGLHVQTSESPTETLIDGTGMIVREVDENGNITNVTMVVKDGEVEAARFKANETFTYDSQKGYITTMKTYYSSADNESGIGWYWRRVQGVGN